MKTRTSIGVSLEERLNRQGFSLISGLPCDNGKMVDELPEFQGMPFWEQVGISENGPETIIIIKTEDGNIMVARLPNICPQLTVAMKILESLDEKKISREIHGLASKAYKLCYGEGIHRDAETWKINPCHLIKRLENMKWDPNGLI